MALSPERIAAAALALGDRDGPDAMSMRRIAAELGCDPMALYRHFPNREALLDAVADLVMTEVPLPGTDLPWDQRLRDLAGAIRSAALRHPGIAAHVAARPPLGPSGRRLAGAMVAALTDAGLPPADTVRALQALIAHLSAALAMAVRAGASDPRWAEVAAFLGAPPDHLPVTGSDEQFDYALTLLLTGLRTTASTQHVFPPVVDAAARQSAARRLLDRPEAPSLPPEELDALLDDRFD